MPHFEKSLAKTLRMFSYARLLRRVGLGFCGRVMPHFEKSWQKLYECFPMLGYCGIFYKKIVGLLTTVRMYSIISMKSMTKDTREAFGYEKT